MEASTNIIIIVSYHHDLECHAMPWNDRIKRNLKLSDLDTLMTVVQTGAMGRASVQLHMSQPAVSKAIADLERTFGVRLLHRSRRRRSGVSDGLRLCIAPIAPCDDLAAATTASVVRNAMSTSAAARIPSLTRTELPGGRQPRAR